MSATQRSGSGDLAERGFFAIVLGLTVTSCVALILAQLGHLGVFAVVAILSIIALAGWRLLFAAVADPESRPVGRHDAMPIVPLAILIVLAGVLFTPPFRPVVWAGDATVYAVYGVHIGRTGAYMSDDSLLRTMPVDRRRALFRNQAPADLTGDFARLPGGIAIADVERGRVAAGFAPMFPILIALFSQVVGAANVFWIAPLLGVGGVAALFFAGRAIGGNATGFIGGLLLAVCMPQIWFSRIPMSEIASQFFVIGGFWIAVLFLRTRTRRLAIASGLSLGVAGLTGYDVMVAEIVAVATFAAWTMASGRRIEHARLFAAAFGSTVIYAVAHLSYYPSNYAGFIARRLQLLSFWPGSVGEPATAARIGLFAAGILVAALAVLALAWALKTTGDDPEGRRRVAGLALCAAIALMLAIYLAPITPRLDATVSWLAAYLSWPLLVFFGAVAGGLLIASLRRGGDAYSTGLLAAFVVGAAPVLYNPQVQDVGTHLATMRRFVPFVIPGILLVTAAGVVAMAARLAPPLRRRALVASVVVLFALVASPSRALIGARYWDGAVRQSETLAATFPDDGVVLVSRELAGTQIQATLTYLYGRDSLVLQPDPRRSRLLEDQIVDWLRGGRPVFLLASNDGRHFWAPGIALTEHFRHELSVRVLDDDSPPPRRVQTREVPLIAYRMSAVEERPLSVDVGAYGADAMHGLEGFHESENDDFGSYRWSGPVSSISVPRRPRIALLLSGARPAGTPPAVVSIWVGSRQAVESRVVSDTPVWVVLDLAADTASTTIRVESSTFSPATEGLSGDARELGVRLYEIDLNR